MFLKGLILGFSIAAPVGPIGLLCIQRTLARGRRHGFVSGLGAATADTLYGLIAALGLSVFTQLLLGLQFWLQAGGGVFLVVLGWQTLKSAGQPRVAATATNDSGLWRAFASVLVLTLANPATILAFIAVFASLGISETDGPLVAAQLVAGVFLGSAAWWLMLSLISGLLRGHLNDGRMRAVNYVAGGSITALGLWALHALPWEKI